VCVCVCVFVRCVLSTCVLCVCWERYTQLTPGSRIGLIVCYVCAGVSVLRVCAGGGSTHLTEHYHQENEGVCEMKDFVSKLQCKSKTEKNYVIDDRWLRWVKAWAKIQGENSNLLNISECTHHTDNRSRNPSRPAMSAIIGLVSLSKASMVHFAIRRNCESLWMFI
jgi:hypothetical protein